MIEQTFLHAECVDNPHPCFSCKLRIWRSEGSSPLSRMRGVALGTNGERFFDTTVRTEQARIVADAKRAGLSPEPVGARWV